MTRARIAVTACVAAFALTGASAGQQLVFRGGVDLVQVDVAVTLRNRPVPNLVAADFAISDNGVPQTILEVSRETMPIDLTLILDMSATGGAIVNQPVTTMSLVRAINKVRGSLRPDDRVALVTFDKRVHEVVPLGPAASFGALNLARPMSPMLVSPAASALFDALTASLPTVPVAGRRQVTILFTSGPDTISFLDEAVALDIARRSSGAVFVVGSTVDPNPVPTSMFSEPADTANSSRPPPDRLFGTRPLPTAFLRSLTEETGGTLEVVAAAIYLANSLGHIATRVVDPNLDASFIRALDDFRTRYVLQYTLTGVPRAGYHALAVRVTKSGAGYQVKARKGYAGR